MLTDFASDGAVVRTATTLASLVTMGTVVRTVSVRVWPLDSVQVTVTDGCWVGSTTSGAPGSAVTMT